MVTKFAIYISRLFEPFSLSFVALILIINHLGTSLNEKVFWFATAVILGGFPPLAVLVYEKKIGKIKDWFISNRLERRDVHFAWFFGSGLFSLVVYVFNGPKLLLALSLTLLIISFIVTLTSMYWKISVHMVGVSLFVLILLLVYSASLLWIAFLIPLVAWARVKVKAHTLTQVTVGSIVTLLVTYSVFKFFGLANF